MQTKWLLRLLGVVLAVAPLAAAFGQGGPGVSPVSQANFDSALRNEGNWYFSWG